MSKAAKYSAIELLRNGRAIEMRALRSDDRAGLLAAVGRIARSRSTAASSSQSKTSRTRRSPIS